MKGQKRLLGVNFFTLSEFETSMQRWMVICRFFFEHFLRSDGSLASLKWLAAFYALTDNLKRQQTLDRFFQSGRNICKLITRMRTMTSTVEQAALVWS
jgi:hypothetical protein